MKSVFYASLAAIALLFAAPAARAGEPDVNAALTAWKDAVESASLDDILKLYDKNAIMISTFAQAPLTTRAALTKYYKVVVGNSDIHVEITETHPRRFGTMAVNSGQYTLSYTQDGEDVVIPARFSFTYVLQGGKWIIVDQHSSRVPLAE